MQGERRQCLQFDTESICPDVIKSVYNASIVLRFFLHQCARSPILMKDNFKKLTHLSWSVGGKSLAVDKDCKHVM